MKLSIAIDGFILAKRADGLSQNTARIYRDALGKLVTFTSAAELESITTDDLRHWLVWLQDDYKPPRKEHLSVATIQGGWVALKSFYHWACEELRIPRVDDIKRPTGESPIVRPFTADEVRSLLHAAEYCTTNGTDKRKSYSRKRPEAARLTVGDVDLANGSVLVAPFGSDRKSKPRIVYLGKRALKELWKYLAKRDAERGTDKRAPLFLTDEGRALSRDAIILLVKRIGPGPTFPTPIVTAGDTPLPLSTSETAGMPLPCNACSGTVIF
jgi:site-specific recombinase XerD